MAKFRRASASEPVERLSWLDRLYGYSIDHFVHWRRHVKEYAWAILIVLVVRSTLLTVYRIPTGSMIPTFKVGDVLIANHFYYGLKMPWTHGLEGFRLKAVREVDRGDILIFQGPREEVFRIVHLRFFDEVGGRFLRSLNQRSDFKRPIRVHGEGRTNYIFLKGYEEHIHASHGEVVVALHPSLYGDFELFASNTFLDEPMVRLRLRLRSPSAEVAWNEWSKVHSNEVLVFSFEDKFVKDVGLKRSFYESEVLSWLKGNDDVQVLEEGTETHSFSVEKVFERSYYMTYHSHGKGGFWRNFWNTPLTGLSITGTVLLNTPLFFVYALPLKIFVGESIYKKLSLYPNPYLNNAKDYVKRVIAVGGDTVEIVNKKVYVNGRLLLSLGTMPISDEDNTAYKVYEEVNEATFEQGSAASEQGSASFGGVQRRYRVRFDSHLRPAIPSEAFDAATWPLDPNRNPLMRLDDYKDNFGPVKVEPGHYFVMGDNRDESFDSRYWGLVPHYAVKGAVMLRLLPLARFGKVR